MVRVFVLYTEEPDAGRYAQHANICRQVPGVTVRHGKVLRTLHGEPEVAYYAELEFPDMDSFNSVARSDAMRATGTDAADMGIPHMVYLAEVE
jgi:hypothetical protein